MFLLPVYSLQAKREEVELIKAKEEKEGPTHASALLLDMIQNVDSLGWFQMFLDGLSMAGYPTLSKSIDMEDFTELDKSRLYKQMVRKLRPTLEPGARPMDILPHLSECLLQPQEEEVRQVYADMSGTEEIEMTYSQEAEMEDLHANLDTDAEPRQKVVRYDSQISSPLTELRAYQEELALPALESRNTIICAPTGSGKTIIAVEICWQHLRQGTEESKRKVAFLANTIPLCQQQMELFMKYFQNTDFEVTGCFGDSSSNLAVKVAVEEYDIIVMTPMILQLNLENGTIPSLSTFTLIFFDECHNTSKKHSYNSIMGMYMDIRLQGPPSTALPQIVGLTASVGVGKSKNVDGALEHIYQLCANLDTHTLSTVTKHLNELRKFVFVPSKDIRLVKRRSVDPFMDVVLGLMAHVESIAKKTYNIESLSKVPMSTRGSQAYEQWVVTVQRQCKVLKLVDQDEEEEMKICRKLVTCSEHLRKYNDSLIISEDARAIDAINYLQKYFDNLDPTRFDETDQKLFSVFEERSKELLRIASSSGRENPKLQELQSVLDEQYHYNSETKTILFVKTRALAEAIEQWILETPALAHLKPKVLIGRRRTENTAGMTLSTQKDALSAFESEGGSKLLIATSVADEGIDVAQCNLVLLYDYVGNVIKMVQTRGRGRAMDSRCILITSSRENAEKEQINMLQEKVMYDAIQTAQNVETDVFLAKNNHRVVISKAFLSLCNIQPHPKPQVCDVLEKKSKIFCRTCNRDWGILASCMGLDNLPVLKISGFTFVNLRTGQRKSVVKWQDFPGLIKDFDFELDVLDQDSKRSKELLRIASSSGRENPKLQELQSVLDEQYHYNSETKTILFVKTRALAEAIEQWILETPALAHLKPKVLIGRRRTENTAGMTLSTQKDALSAFESEGGSKLLIATSVADEGIDVAQCNLVLLYDYVGNVIKMVQTRGRGRAMDSRCILITSSRENAEKEQINMLQEKVMYDAIQTAQNVETDVFLAKEVFNCVPCYPTLEMRILGNSGDSGGGTLESLTYSLKAGGVGSSGGPGSTYHYTFHGDPHATFASFFGGSNPFDMFFGPGRSRGTTNGFDHVGGEQDMDLDMDGDEDPFSAFGRFGNGVNGFHHGGGGRRHPAEPLHRRGKLQDAPVVHELRVSLEEIFHGCTKRMKITRRRLNPDGRTARSEDKILHIVIKRGWKEGTKITFPKEGDETPENIPADIAFVLKDKPHPHFKRDGSNIIYSTTICLKEALCGCTVNIPTIDNRVIPLPCTDIIKPGTVKRLRGEGLPFPKSPTQRGDLIVEFKVRFPDRIPPQSREILKQHLPLS
ncbi:UNVERIFIED_CONTAM: hypothetical protein FKN15_012890 [Acipenser sinensis]